MIKLLFRPVGMLGGLFAGRLSQRVFGAVWRRVDENQPPQPQQRLATLPRLALALALEGAVFRMVRGLVDNASRRGFARATGRWPGDAGGPDQTQG